MRSFAAALAVVFASPLLSAHAGSDSATFLVKLTITESCKFVTTSGAITDVDFGTNVRTASSANVDAAGKLTINCSPGTAYSVGLSGGANSTGTAASPAPGERRMKHGTLTEYVAYDLFSNATRTTFWGNTSGKMVSDTAPSDGSDVVLAVYGRTNDLNHSAGSYQDTVTATVTY